MSKVLRHKIADEIGRKLQGVDTYVVVEYRGLKSQQAADLRATLREGKVSMTVMKNRVATRAFEKLGIGKLTDLMEGPTAVVWSREDPAAVTKRLLQWQEKNKVLVIKGGLVGRQPLGPDQVKALSQLPTREQMLGLTIGTVTAPLSGLAGALNGLLSGVAGAVQALADKMPKA